MACFLVSTAEAIVVTAAAKAVKNNEMKAASQKLAKKASIETKQEKHLPWSKKLMILAQLLWGGAFLLPVPDGDERPRRHGGDAA